MDSCTEVMTRDPATCVPSDTAREAAALMKGQNVGPIPVVESRQSKRLVGIVTDRDLVLRVVAEGRDPSNTRIEEVMTRNPVSCAPGENLQKVLDAMSEHQIRRIPVVDDQNNLIGIISQADVATRIGAPKKTAQVVEKVSRPASAGA